MRQNNIDHQFNVLQSIETIQKSIENSIRNFKSQLQITEEWCKDSFNKYDAQLK